MESKCDLNLGGHWLLSAEAKCAPNSDRMKSWTEL